MSELVEMLLDSGLLQFGRFAGAEGWEPYRLNLQWLPSYPEVLRRLTEDCAGRVGQVDHLVCPVSTLPLGVALSLRTGIPLVYSRETDEAPVYDLVGAYDIGHPALLVAYCSSDLMALKPLVERARRVGLEIHRAVILMDEGRRIPVPDHIDITALIHLPEIFDELLGAGRLPAGQAELLIRWTNSHPPG